MPRTEEANQRIREAQRARILEGARKVLARKGLAATMADVAAAAGVSQGLAYRYFENKEALLRALLEQAVQASETGLQRLKEMPGTPGERLVGLLTKVVEGRRDFPEFYHLLYPELSDQAISANYREMMHRQGLIFFETLRQLIVEAQATGEIVQDDPDQLVAAVIAYLDGLTRLALYDPERLRQHFPGPEILLRIFKPASDLRGASSQPAGEA